MANTGMTMRNAPRLFLGLVIITLGVVALLDKLGVVPIDDIWRFWPLVFIALGFARLLRPRGSPGRFMGGVFVLVGVWFQLAELGLWPYKLFDMWPLIVVLVGARLVWGAIGRSPSASPSDSSSRLSTFAMFGGSEHKSSAGDFQGGDATAILGSCKLDLRNATIQSEAVVDVFALWGGVEIVVPRGWSVVLQGTPLFGAFVDKSEAGAAGGPRLVVKGVAIMGSVEIKN